MSVAFDTLKAAQRLSAAGFTQEQAATLAATFAEGITENLATRDDIALVRKDIDLVRKDVDLVRKDVEALDMKIDTAVAALDTKIDTAVAALDTKIDTAVTALDTKIDLVKETLETKIESASRNTIIWLGSAIIAAAILLGVIERVFPPPG